MALAYITNSDRLQSSQHVYVYIYLNALFAQLTESIEDVIF